MMVDLLNRTLDDSRRTEQITRCSRLTEQSTKCNSTACAARQAIATKGCI